MQEHMTASNNTTRTTEIISMSDIGTVSAVETVETSTTVTTKTTTTIHVTKSPDTEVVKTIEPRVVTSTAKKLEANSKEGSPEDKNSSFNNEKNGNGDKQTKSELMNIQSVCPTSKPATFVVLNRQGKQMKISLAPRNTDTEDKTEEKSENDGPSQGKWLSF